MPWSFCPHCGGSLEQQGSAQAPYAPYAQRQAPPAPAAVQQGPYNQVAYWKKLVTAGSTSSPGELVQEAVRQARAWAATAQAAPGGFTSIVHLILDRPATPRGGILLQAVESAGRIGTPTEEKRQQLEGLGYLFNDDGTLFSIDEVPVGLAYQALLYWGGDKQHKRWHMSEPIEVNPSRHGDPCFMDDNMIAFRAKWTDLERLQEALDSLTKTLSVGFSGRPAGNVTMLDLYWKLG